MLRLAVLVTAAGLLAAAPAGAQAGLLCGYTVVDGEKIPGAESLFEVDGGPQLADGDVQVICTIQAGYGHGSHLTHAGTDVAVTASLTTPGAAVLPPTAVAVVLPPLLPEPPFRILALCTAARVDGVLRYWDGSADAWSDSPDVPCSYAITGELTCSGHAIHDADGDGDEEAVVAGLPVEPVDLDADGDDDLVGYDGDCLLPE